MLTSTLVGALAGGMIAGLTTNNRKDADGDSDRNGDLIAGCMTAGLWAGFGLGVVMTRDSAPDPKYDKGTRQASPTSVPTSTNIVPFVGEQHAGVMVGGTW